MYFQRVKRLHPEIEGKYLLNDEKETISHATIYHWPTQQGWGQRDSPDTKNNEKSKSGVRMLGR